MKVIPALLCLIVLTGCTSTRSTKSVYDVRVFHHFNDIPRPYAVIGTITATSPTNEPIYMTRLGLRHMASNQKADGVLITYINPNPEDLVFYTAPSSRVNLAQVSTFELVRDSSPENTGQTVITAAGHNKLPLTAVFIRYLD